MNNIKIKPMNGEIFLPITKEIAPILRSGYYISNFGRIIGENSNRGTLGKMHPRYKRFKCNLMKENGDCLYNADVAILEYCVFNNIPFNTYLRIGFKDNNPENLMLDNLFEPNSIIVPLERKYIPFKNYTMSSATYNSNNIKQLYFPLEEYWLPITENEVDNIENNCFFISDLGRLYRSSNNTIVPQQIADNGYVSYIIYNKYRKQINLLVHRLVLKCFSPIKDMNNFEVDHINSNTLDNRLINLRWVSHNYNEQLRFMENTNRILFTEEQVITICEAFKSGMNPMQISYYILHTPYIGSIHSKLMDIYRGRTYKEIRNKYTF